MICFPLDNTEYEASALGAWCGTRTRGVFAADGHYAVTSNGDMTVTVSPGLAWLKAGDYWGVNAYEISPQRLTIATADGALSRIDAICIRLDKNKNRGELVIKQGSYSPQPPTVAAPARNLDYDEIYVATIAVRAGATEITPADITDQRLNEAYCGVMRDGVTGIPTQQLQDQVEALIEDLKAAISAVTEGTIFDPYTVRYIAQSLTEGERRQARENIGAAAAAHASTHALGGADPLAPAAIGAATATQQTAVLTAAGWSGGVQTVAVTGVTENNGVVVSPAPASFERYGDAGVFCSAQTAGGLTFSCSDVPTEDLSVNVLIVGVV